MSDVDPGGYVEVQMDRQAVVLAAVGVVVLLVLAFMLGRWTAPETRAAGEDAAAEASDDDGSESEAVITEDESVDGEPMFGSRPVTAAGAPPVAPVPAPSERPIPPLGAASGRSSAPSSSATTTARRTSPTTTARRAAARPAPPAATIAANPPAAASGAWLIQVAAVREPGDADALRRKLEGKGYPVRVVSESGLHKVQVGPYVKKSEAQVVAQRLEREERLGTWLKPT